MKKVEIILRNGKTHALSVYPEPLSIFDQQLAGQGGTDGNFYIILRSRSNGDYAVSKENYYAFMEKGKWITEPGETLEINGEMSRAMTEKEEEYYNSGLYDSDYVVDLWGNMKICKFKVNAKYEKTDWFTGGVHIYRCISRTENTVTMSAIYDEIDGVHVQKPETFDIQKADNGEQNICKRNLNSI